MPPLTLDTNEFAFVDTRLCYGIPSIPGLHIFKVQSFVKIRHPHVLSGKDNAYFSIFSNTFQGINKRVRLLKLLSCAGPRILHAACIRGKISAEALRKCFVDGLLIFISLKRLETVADAKRCTFTRNRHRVGKILMNGNLH